jgi:hypothetical protein
MLRRLDDFPEFMKHAVNRIANSHQATPGVEGYARRSRRGPNGVLDLP